MNLRPQKRYESNGPKTFMNTRHKNMNLRAQDVFMFFCEPTKKCEHKAPKILQTEGDHVACSGECIWGGGAAPSSCFSFSAYLLCRDSLPETSPPPINSQNISAPTKLHNAVSYFVMLHHIFRKYPLIIVSASNHCCLQGWSRFPREASSL